MEVVAATPNGGGVPPFHDHDVREWSRLDSLTGVLERARLETDHWTANTSISSHKYGKVVDSRARTDADGAVQQKARRQLEVYHSQIPGGHLQVIKTHTVSSSRWSSSTTTNKISSSSETTTTEAVEGPSTRQEFPSKDFGDLQLTLNPLDLTSQKSKANLGRSVIGRRPPSRPRTRDEPVSSSAASASTTASHHHNNTQQPLRSSHHQTAAVNLHRVSRLCHQIHDTTVRQTFGRYLPQTTKQIVESPSSSSSTNERQNSNGIDIVEIENSSVSSSTTTTNESERISIAESATNNNNKALLNGNRNNQYRHPGLTRTKSTSSEDLHLLVEKGGGKPLTPATKGIEDLEHLEELQNWRRTSKLRRSLQYPLKHSPSDENATYTTAISKNSIGARPHDFPENSGSVRKIREELEKGRRLSTALRGNTVDLDALDQILQSLSNSSNSNSNSSDNSTQSDKTSTIDDDQKYLEENSELQDFSTKQKRNSFVTVETLQEVRGRLRRTSSPGIDKMLSENNSNNRDEESDDGIVTEDTNSNSVKSSPKSRVRSYVYGMEALLNKKPILGTGSLESRSKVLSGNSNVRNDDWYNRRKSYGFEQVHHGEATSTISSLKSKNRMESSTDSGICRSSEITIATPVLVNGVANNTDAHLETNINGFSSVKQISSIFDQSNRNSGSFPDAYSDTKSNFKTTKITIPVTSRNTSNCVDFPEREIKRHSIAVDESKYVFNNENISNAEPRYRRTSLASSAHDHLEDMMNQHNRKSKKVEFCKTEVHFAADSGRVNIVETDEKPPPTQNFRRRRRNSGPILDVNEYERNGLPVLHFGDSSYEKSLLLGLGQGQVTNEDDSGSASVNSKPNQQEDLYQNAPSSLNKSNGCSTVTVNQSWAELQEAERRDLENDSIKGILKNKPIKPVPYHLGEHEQPAFLNQQQSSDSDSGKWGVRLKPVNRTDPPFWKSTVTLHNTVYGEESNKVNGSEQGQPEFQKLLKNLRPTSITKPPDLISPGTAGDPYYSNKFVPSASAADTRRSWSIADKIKLNDDSSHQWTENKLYSTKVNFGDGGTTIVKNNDTLFKDADSSSCPKWISNESPVKDSKPIVNKGLVVRIGRNEAAKPETSSTTTTKITIDLSPSPTTSATNKSLDLQNRAFSPTTLLSNHGTKYHNQRSQHSFKSTSLILDTIRNENNPKNNDLKAIPQLEVLRKLYEDIQSDSDADKEVQVLMEKQINSNGTRYPLDEDEDNNSVVSGSWSKMGAYKIINKHFNTTVCCGGHKTSSHRLSNAEVEKDSSNGNIPSTGTLGTDIQSSSSSNQSGYQRTINKEAFTEMGPENGTLSSVYQPKTCAVLRRADLKNVTVTERLSSPSLVGKNSTPKRTLGSTYQNEDSTNVDFVNISDTKLQQKTDKHDVVLRQPKKSEMTYFGVNVSSKPAENSQESVIISVKDKKLSDKPDLLQHMKNDGSAKPTVFRHHRPRKTAPEEESPIYENVSQLKLENKTFSREFDQNILEELTKAADQILQAVNGFAAEEEAQSRLLADDKNEPLETISETKSWQKERKPKIKSSGVASNTTVSKPVTTNSGNRAKLKHTSSNSSLESISRELRRSTPSTSRQRYATATQSSGSKSVQPQERLTKKKSTATSSDSSSAKANIKARRLQRASSREALLHSHGSSSEDLGANTEVAVPPPRKHRHQIRKTKVAQLSVTNGIEMKKVPTASSQQQPQQQQSSLNPVRRKTSEDAKLGKTTTDDRTVEAVPEIRHKTAISTIRSTAEKCNRDRSKTRTSEESRRKGLAAHQRKENSRGASSSSRNETRRSVLSTSTREAVNHRISTANIKKCSRTDVAAASKH